MRGGLITVLSVFDAAGRRRSPATLPGYHAGRPLRNKGMRYPADPPTVDEIIAVMRHTADDRHGGRLRAMIIVLWRAGLRVQEALALAEHDLDQRRGSILVRHAKGGRRREVGMDDWGWEQLRPWPAARAELPVAPLFCIIDGPTRGRPWSGPRSVPSSADSPCAPASGVGSPGETGRLRTDLQRTRGSSVARATLHRGVLAFLHKQERDQRNPRSRLGSTVINTRPPDGAARGPGGHVLRRTAPSRRRGMVVPSPCCT